MKERENQEISIRKSRQEIIKTQHRSIIKTTAIFPNTDKTKSVFPTPRYCQLIFMLEENVGDYAFLIHSLVPLNQGIPQSRPLR